MSFLSKIRKETLLPLLSTLVLFLSVVTGVVLVQRQQLLRTKAVGNTYYVAPSGGGSNSGTISNPWDIVTALERGGNPSGTIQPGDVIMLRGGTYGNGRDTLFNVRISGGLRNDIIIRPYYGEHVIIGGGFNVYGKYLVFTNAQGSEFEVRFSDWRHNDGSVGRYFKGLRGSADYESVPPHNGFRMMPGSQDVDIINLVIHDTAQGVVNQEEGRGGTVYGALIYNTGTQRSDRGHGHGFYFQNNYTDVKRIEEVVTAHNFAKGGQWYGTAPELNNGIIRGSVFVNDDLIWYAGNSGIENAVIDENTVRGQWAVDLYSGYYYPTHKNITVTDNKIHGTSANSRFPLDFGPFTAGTITGNRITSSGGSLMVQYKTPPGTAYPQIWNNNDYYCASGGCTFRITNPGSTGTSNDYSFADWQRETRYDASSSYTPGRPTGVQVEVRPNAYEIGRANVIIHNWDERGSVDVNLSGTGLVTGDTFEMRNVLNYFGDTPITGTFSTASPLVSVDMRASRWTYVRPIGASDSVRSTWPKDDWGIEANNPFPQFGVFILRKKGVGTPQPPATAVPTKAPTPTSTSSPTPTPTPQSSPTLPPSGTNLIRNPNFEQGTQDWTFYTDASGTFIAGSPAYEGAAAAKVVITTPGTNVQLYQQGVSLEPNTVYRLEFAARSNTGHDLSVFIHQHVSPYTNYGLNNFVANLTSSWQTFSTTFTSTNSVPVNDARLRFWFSPYDVASDEYFIDAVTLTKITPTSTPLPLPGDIDKDGDVDIFDYNLMITDFGKTGQSPADLDADGVVDIFDYNILLTNFGKTSGTPTTEPTPTTGPTVTYLETGNGVSFSEISKEFYSRYEDDYDFLAIFNDFGQRGQWHITLKNTVEGIGMSIFDNSATYGSNGRLKGIANLGYIKPYYEDEIAENVFIYNALLEEVIAHQWGVDVGDIQDSNDSLPVQNTLSPYHWTPCMSFPREDVTQPYWKARLWKDNGDGTWTIQRTEAFSRIVKFDPFMLYLMGFLSPEDVTVNATLISPNGSDKAQQCVSEYEKTVQGTARPISINDIIEKHGPRNPPAHESQKDFSIAYILLIKKGTIPSVVDLEKLSQWGTNFPVVIREATSN